MAKIKLSTTPQTTTITHIVTSPTLCRISWDSEPDAIVNITNIGTNLPPKGYSDKTITGNITFIIDSISPNGLTSQRVINFVYQPLTAPSINPLSILKQDGAPLLLENGQEMTLQG